jgi:hypothetical protein
VVSQDNSLVGTHSDDHVRGTHRSGVVALTNGKYVVGSPNWANGDVANAGAATWGNGATGTTGVVVVAGGFQSETRPWCRTCSEDGCRPSVDAHSGRDGDLIGDGVGD